MFSSRTGAAEVPRNRLTRALERARREGRPILDLTLANPTAAAFEYPPDLLEPLGRPRGLTYAPDPLGLPAARSAVSAEYARQGLCVPPDRIAMAASTSEAYSLLFKVLCDAGDEVLVPRPSYPLFEHLVSLDGIVATHYDLEYHGRWSVDVGSVEAALSPRTRALLIVSPNNPTGSLVTRAEIARLAGLAGPRGIALVADEVFADYELAGGALARAGRVLAQADVLSFALGGLSKSIGLPQVKLAWIGAAGPAALVEAALARIELAADTYLTVGTPVQLAAAELLEAGQVIRRQIQARIGQNAAHLQSRAALSPSCTVLPSDAGWYAVVRVPSLQPEDDLVVDLLATRQVLAHPGYFFDFPCGSHLILSLLPPPALFAEGVDRILQYIQYIDQSAGGRVAPA